MKKNVTSMLLALSMTLPMVGQAGATGTDQALQVSALSGIDSSIETYSQGTTTLTQQEAADFVLRWAGMTVEQLGTYPQDSISMAKSVGIVGEDFDAEAPCTQAMLDEMSAKAQGLYEALHADKLVPYFANGVAQPIFPYTSGMVSDEEYSNADSDIIRFPVYVETNYDTDGDGKLDLIKALVQLPKAAAEGDYKAATIYEARPYITGCTEDVDTPFGEEGYDLSKMYAQPAARTAAGTATTMEAAAQAKASDWYFLSPYESAAFGDFYDYEDLDWYDYFLVRGYAVVEVGGLGTKDSEGFETCGSDLETDAFKCVVEWLTGDRVAYTDRTSNIAISADWSNGKVGMTGRSYGGTTDFAVASTGVKGLETIVPVAGIASWYEYTNSQGISMDVDYAYSDHLAFYCSGRYIDAEDYATVAEDYGNYLKQIWDDQNELAGNYGEHWANRDYTVSDGKVGTYDNFNCSALIVHGLNDNNVKTKQFQMMYDAFTAHGQEVKLLLHQGAHITPDYDSHKTSLPIDGESYNGILNKWFSHYLYGQDNGAEDMAAVTVQNNTDGSWTTLDQWETDKSVILNCLSDEAATTISSDLSAIEDDAWTETILSGDTNASVVYTKDIDSDTTIQGTVAVHIKAAPTQHPDSDSTDSRDGLMMAAMLVDMADEPFDSFPTRVTEKKTGEQSWVGGGVANYDIIDFKPNNATYKIIAQGWMDLADPNAGFDSASADDANKVQLVDGQFYDYTLYLQPNCYTVEGGHKLALVIYTYDPDMAQYEENYAITIDNTASYAAIPVAENSAVWSNTSFADVTDTAWYATAVQYATEKSLMNGTGSNCFSPNGTTTRGTLMTILARDAGQDTNGGSTWYANGMEWAKSAGISDGNAPEAAITREQLVTMLYRYAQSQGKDVSASAELSTFSDAASTSSYAVEAMEWAVAQGIVAGNTAGALVPQATATRAEIATILMRFLSK